MDQVSIFLLTVAGVFLIGVVGEVVFQRTQVPDAVWLVLVGVLLGPVTGLLRHEWLQQIAPVFAALTLIVILFDGGRQLRGDALGRSAFPAVALALFTFGLSCATVTLLAQAAAAIGWLAPPWSLRHSLLLGTILGGSSSVVIMPSMRVAGVAPPTAALVGLESAITDVLCVVGAGTITQLLLHGAQATSPAAVLGRMFGLGLALGAAAGAIWMLVLALLRGNRSTFPLTLSVLLVLYVVVDRLGGSAALAVLTFAVLVGNAPWILHRARFATAPIADATDGDVYSQLVFIVKSFFFTFIGAMLGPPWNLAALGLIVGIVLLPVRLPGAWLTSWMLRLPPGERGILSVAVPRGLAAGVLATLPMAAGVPGTQLLPSVVFPAVVTTILVFTVGFRRARGAGASRPPATTAAAPEASTPEAATTP